MPQHTEMPGPSALPTLPFMALLQAKPKHGLRERGAGASPGPALTPGRCPRHPQLWQPCPGSWGWAAESLVSAAPQLLGSPRTPQLIPLLLPLQPPSLPLAAPILPQTTLQP